MSHIWFEKGVSLQLYLAVWGIDLINSKGKKENIKF